MCVCVFVHACVRSCIFETFLRRLNKNFYTPSRHDICRLSLILDFKI